MGEREATISEIADQLKELTDSEKRKIISLLSNSLIHGELWSDFDRDELTDARYSHDRKCPFCESTSIVKNGTHGGRQRFLCKECDKTFGETTNTVLHSTKKDLKQWVLFAWCMIRGFSLKRCHEEVEISARTAFFWRHKILFAIADEIKNDTLDGLVETDETYFLESHKGKRNIDWKKMGRLPRTRGGVATLRGLSKEQICVICSLDRSGHILSEPTGRSRPNHVEIERFFDGRLAPDSVLCTDSLKGYKTFAKDHNIQIKQIPSGKFKLDIYHIQHVNAYHSRMKHWMMRFQGVATKYLNNYMAWFKWLDLQKGVRERDKSQKILSTAYSVDYSIRWEDFKLVAPSFA